MYRRRFYSHTPGKSRHRAMFLFLLCVTLIFAVQSFMFVDRSLKPPLMKLAKARAKQIAVQSINSAISESLSQGTDYDKLIDWQRDNSGHVTSFVLNYGEHMRIAADTVNIVHNQLAGIQQLPERIPLGQAFDSALMATYGPSIPIRLTPIGSAQVTLHTRHENAGINMILVEVYIRVIAELTIMIPFDSEPEVVETEIPVTYVLVVGGTPMYYVDNKGNPVGGSSPLPTGIAIPQLAPPVP